MPSLAIMFYMQGEHRPSKLLLNIYLFCDREICSVLILLVTVTNQYDDGLDQADVKMVTKANFGVNVEGRAYRFIQELDMDQ